MIIKILESKPHIEPEYLSYITNHELVPFEKEISPELIEWIIIRSQIKANAELLKTMPNLKYIFRVGVGLDGVDLPYCRENDIKVINTPGANADAVADLVVRWILTLLRRTNLKKYNRQDRYDYEWDEPSDQKIWIVGFGNIGKKIYKRLLGFGVKEFLIYDPFLTEDQVSEYNWCIYIDKLDSLTSEADVLTLHLPLTDDTRHIISKHTFAKAKSNLKIINTSRWGIIDENALYEFLKQNPKAGAYMDVWEAEPKLEWIINELIALDNFVLTPHIGAMTTQATKNMHYFKELE